MIAAEGILTARGGLVSHAAVVARGWGKPGGVRRRGGRDRRRRRSSPSAASTVQRGRRHLDQRHHRRGRARRGGAGRRPSRRPSSTTILGWADEIRTGKLAVRANADTGRRRRPMAREFGAEGIGLCRTEHMFLGDRLPIVRRMILADTPRGGGRALDELRGAPAGRLRRGSSRRWTGCRSPSGCSTRRCTSSCPTSRSCSSSEATDGLDAEEQALLDAAARVAGGEPDARHPGRAPRRPQARPLRDAGAGAHGGGRRARSRPAATRSSRS